VAARFWRWVLAGELVVAAVVAWVSTLATPWPLAFTIVLVPVAFLVLQVLLVAGTLVFGRLSAHGASMRLHAVQALRVCLTEAPTFTLAKLAMSVEPWQSCPKPVRVKNSAPARPVLLVHGVLCNRAVWRPLYRRLRSAGFAPIRAINLEPLCADIDAYADQMVREVSALRSEARGVLVAVVAHSMGGLVARAAMRRGASASISHLITLGTPHHGSALGRCVPGPAGRQLQRSSTWLQALNAQENRFSALVTSIYSEDDNLVVPARSAALEGAECHALHGIGHFGLLRSPQALEHVLAALLHAAA